MLYDNSRYWQSVHKEYAGQLRAVGHPWLSEQLNELKYGSEAETLLNALERLRPGFQSDTVSILDVGAGTGYWIRLLCDWFARQGLKTEVSALDISLDALQSMKASLPYVHTIHTDLKTVDPSSYANSFDLVVSFYCLHHLVNINDFLNGLRFVGRSVGKGGLFIIMDPILTKPFSTFNSLDFATYTGNGIPRHLYLLDDMLSTEGLRREIFFPAVSFLLNGNIEAGGRLGFLACQMIWGTSQKIYQSESLTKKLSKILATLDRMLKKRGIAFSSSLCAYRKTE